MPDTAVWVAVLAVVITAIAQILKLFGVVAPPPAVVDPPGPGGDPSVISLTKHVLDLNGDGKVNAEDAVLLLRNLWAKPAK